MRGIRLGTRFLPFFDTIDELFKYHYPELDGGRILKADAPIATTTPGVWQARNGILAWINVNHERNLMAALPKKPWDHSGLRFLSGKARTTPQGVTETATIPDSEKSDYVTATAKPKIQVDVGEVTQLMNLVSAYDDAIDALEMERKEKAELHAELINVAFLTDVDTLAGNNFESVDRIVSAYTEVANCGITAGDSDIYGIDRDAGAGWSDAQVEHNSNVDRDLSLGLIDDLFAAIWGEGAKPNLIVTGVDTFVRWGALLQTEQRFFGEGKFVATVNGVQSVGEGYEGGFLLSSYHGAPILCSQAVPKDTISRIYMLNTDYLYFKLLQPTKYYESGIDVTKDPWPVGKLSNKFMYETIGELICTKFHVQGKIRDLK